MVNLLRARRPYKCDVICTVEYYYALRAVLRGITISDITANEERMKAQWAPPTPIETLFKQLKEGTEFAEEVGETISDGQLVRYGYDIFLATGVFTKDCNKWRKKPSKDQTWDKF